MAKKAKADADQESGGVVAMARGLAEIVSEHHLTELVIESEGTTITVRREAAVTMAAPMPMHQMPMQMAAPQPFTGHHGAAPVAAAAPVVDDNERVEKGAVLCIVEAMKLMNEIEADAAGTIVGILVEDGASVEYGQALFKIAT
jgi:biotin carboxyl carrier protein